MVALRMARRRPMVDSLTTNLKESFVDLSLGDGV